MAIMAMAASPSMAQLKSGIDIKNLDKNARPADDFYEFACGGWMKNNPLPRAEDKRFV